MLSPHRNPRAADDVAVNVSVFYELAARWLAAQGAGGASATSITGDTDAAAATRQAHLEALVSSSASFRGEWFPLIKCARRAAKCLGRGGCNS